MTIDEAYRLSFYKDLTSLSPQATLVRHAESGQVFVKKVLTVYDAAVYRYLMAHPVPGTPTIMDIVEDAGQLTVIEEFINGISLDKVEKPLSEEIAVDFLLQLCEIVAGLHHADPPIIHRDIKPSNIIVRDGKVYLLDMNAAKRVHSTSQDTRLIGTVGYAAPEQFGFGASDVRTDIYALGVLLNVLLTDAFPKDKVANGRLGEVTTRCTQMDPSNRYASVEELAMALRGTPDMTADPAARMSWALPGFRSGHPARKIFAGIGYFLLAYGCACLTVENANPIVLWLNRITAFIMFFLMILFSANYRGIRDRAGIGRIQNMVLRVFCVVVMDLAIGVICLIILSALERVLS